GGFGRAAAAGGAGGGERGRGAESGGEGGGGRAAGGPDPAGSGVAERGGRGRGVALCDDAQTREGRVSGFVIVYAALLGLVVGSFLNVCVYRLPAGLSVVTPRSRCPACERAIRWYENVPVASYIALRGRCRGCGERISVQYPLVEAATAVIWGAMALRYGATLAGLSGAVFLTLL